MVSVFIALTSACSHVAQVSRQPRHGRVPVPHGQLSHWGSYLYLWYGGPVYPRLLLSTLVGFSRGAYTARALAGFLYKAGLLPRGNQAQVTFAYKLYKREDEQGVKLCAGFKQTYCQEVKIEFLGVWDTVASVGVFIKRTLPFTNSNRSIKTFRHALALDERRTKFQPNYYHRPSCESVVADTSIPRHPRQEGSNSDASTLNGEVAQWQFFGRMPSKSNKLRKPNPNAQVEQAMDSDETVHQRVEVPSAEDKPDDGPVDDVLEVWFAGCHSGTLRSSMLSIADSLTTNHRRWRRFSTQ